MKFRRYTMKKNLARVAIVLGLTTALSINTFAATFNDVSDKHWAYTGISYMQDNGYMTKSSTGDFYPSAEVSYFELAEILAKATLYVDEKVDKNMDAAFKESIRNNYKVQEPKINAYTTKYSSWEKSANEEIAYLLGRGYLKEDELAKFMVKTADGKEIKNTVVKQDLAVFLVRVMGKQTTAIETYKTTGFSDEAKIKPENRPHVAYLASVGLASGNAKNEFGANDKVNRALVATMTSRALIYKDENLTPKPEVKPDPKPETGVQSAAVEGTVSKVVTKDEAKGETYILLDVEGKTKFYTATKSTIITDKNGDALKVSDVKVGMNVKATVGVSSNTDNIIKLQIVDELSQGDTTDKEDTTTYRGEIERVGRNGDLSIFTSKGVVTYRIGSNAEITYGSKDLMIEDLQVGDSVEVQVVDGWITEVEVTKVAEAEKAKEVSFVKVVNRPEEYVLTVMEGTKQVDYSASKEVDVYRNEDEVEITDLRIGDQLTLKIKDKKVTKIEAESEEQKIKGTIKSILIASTPQVTIDTKDGLEVISITSDTEMYDSDTREDITVRDLLLGSKVEVLVDSKEALSLVVQSAPSKVNYKGTIESVGQSARYIDVLVEYDSLTGERMVIKRINVPSDVTIIIDKEESYRKKLEEGMEVLITYNYGEEMYPRTIEVLN